MRFFRLKKNNDRFISKYYYLNLSWIDRVLYKKIYNNLLLGKNKIVVFMLFARIQKVLFALQLDNPELFYVNFKKVLINIRLPFIIFIFNFYINKSEAKVINNKVDEIFTRICVANEFEFELNLYRYIIENFSYNDEDKETNYSLIGIIKDGKAVCQGFSQFFMMLCQKKNIPCMIATGMVNGEPHAWNIVKIDGKTYNVDVTAGISHKENKIYFSFLNIPDSLMDEYEKETKIICNSFNLNLYYQKKKVFESLLELESLINKYFLLSDKFVLMQVGFVKIDNESIIEYLNKMQINISFEYEIYGRFILFRKIK